MADQPGFVLGPTKTDWDKEVALREITIKINQLIAQISEGGLVGPHAPTHELGGSDEVHLDWSQIVTGQPDSFPNIGAFGVQIDGLGGVPEPGTSRVALWLRVPGTIIQWKILGDQTGSCLFDIKRSGVSIIGAGNKPVVVGADNASSVVVGWTSTALIVGDELEIVLESVSGFTWIALQVSVLKEGT